MKGDKSSYFILRLVYASSVLIASIPHRLLNTYHGNEHIPYLGIDGFIPLINGFVIPYLFWFVYIPLIIIILALTDNENYYQLLTAMVGSTLAAILIFYLYPTTVPRPEVAGTDALSRLLKLVYGMDNPYDCLPSLHVLYTFLTTAFFFKGRPNKTAKYMAFICCVLICLSTIFIKQHYILDVIAALMLGSVFYFIFPNDTIWRRLKGCFASSAGFEKESLRRRETF